MKNQTSEIRVQMWIHDLRTGGAETSLLTEIRAMGGRGVDVTVIVLGTEMTLLSAFQDAGIKVENLGSGSMMTRARRLIGLLNPKRVDVVNTMLFWPNMIVRPLARLRGIPVLTTLVNAEYGSEHRKSSRYGNFGVRAAQLADISTSIFSSRFRAVSDDIAIGVSQRLLIPRRKMITISRGRNLELLGQRTPERRERMRATLEIKDQHLLISIGRQDRQKAQEIAIQAIRKLDRNDVILLLVGRPGESSQEIESLLEHSVDLRRRVRVLGEREDIGDLLAAADFFVFPSRWEGMPGTVIEAMALEVPLLLSDIPGSREVSGGHAWFYRVDDVDGLAAALERGFLGEYPNSEVMAARDRCHQIYSVQIAAEKLVALFRDMAKS